MQLGHGSGNPVAKIFLVGECWGYNEQRLGEAFVGPAGEELNRMLHEVGITRSECFLSNVVNALPPSGNIDSWIAKKKADIKPHYQQFRGKWVDPVVVQGFWQLLREIELVKPNIIIAFGTAALWALTGAVGVLKWRGSQLMTDYAGATMPPDVVPVQRKLIPVIHPAAILREWSARKMALIDLKRAARERETKEYSNVPEWRFIVRPTFEEAVGVLDQLLARLGLQPTWLDFDLETRAGHIACAGLSWSLTEAICIPLMCVEDRTGYFSETEEADLVWRLYQVLTHPNARVRGQNLLYDAQYTYRHWCFVPRVAQDTMISHHSMWCGLRKSLDFQASMYCDHYVYWKDDGKTWSKDMSEDQLWRYNCIDCVRTREVGEAEQRTVAALGMEPVDDFQQRFFWPVLECMQRGVAIDKRLRSRMADELQDELAKREAYFTAVLGHGLNPKSPKQMAELFYGDLRQRPNHSKPKPGQPRALTTDDKALEKIALEEPLLRPLIRRIQEYRSLGVFLSTFVLAALDVDGRMRTSYNICGTETFRFASAENAFGTGTNLQNVPAGGDAADSDLVLPNVRKLFVPDPGYTIFDTDLSKADLRIVVWESDEREMKAMLKEGADPYIEVAREFYKDPGIKKTRSDGTTDPRYKLFKSFCHGTHYLGTPTGLAQRLGLTVHQADRTQKWYLGRFAAIARWQQDFKAQVASRRYVQNIFGYRRYYFDRPDESMFREAIAWVPQSTVALYINRIWMAIYERFRHIQILLQVHDSLVGQFPQWRTDESLANLAEAAQIVLPYDDPLVIPVGLKTSNTSWGDCE
jgi:DNA polymerase I-like protein with 3'-5' exonuclease and polymerase domains/uracil-DNA glycosylase